MNMPLAAGPSPREQVTGPAVALMVTAGLGAVLGLFSLAINTLGLSLPMLADPDPGSQLQSLLLGGYGVSMALISLLIAGLIFWGAWRMQRLEAWGLSVAVSILAMVPCVSPCCFLGLPFGIWALVVVVKPEIKSAFSS